MNDTTPQKSLKQLMDERSAAFEQFAFIMFVSNPMTQSVQVWIDNGDITYSISKDDFDAILRRTCGPEIADKVYMKVLDYGIPYLFDRDKGTCKQLHEPSGESRLNPKQVFEDVKAQNERTPDVYEGLYDTTKLAHQQQIRIGAIPDSPFGSKLTSTINYSKKKRK